jgi:hypothetical protein
MATDVHIGCTLHSGALTQEVEVTYKIDKKVLKDSNGVDARIKAINPTKDFSVKGHGALTVSVGIGATAIGIIAGGVAVIEQIKVMEKNDDFDGWSYSGSHHPNAQSVT